MRNLLYISTLWFITCCWAKANDATVIVFEKNNGGEIVARVSGHTSSIIFKINDQTITVYPEEGTINLSAMGIETLLLSLRTDSGEGARPDNNAVLPVNPLISPTPPLSTPF